MVTGIASGVKIKNKYYKKAGTTNGFLKKRSLKINGFGSQKT
jgi:hypothetical protein